MILCTLKSNNGATQDDMFTDVRLGGKAGGMLLIMEEAVPWHTGRTYDGHTLKRNPSGWLLVVRTHTETTNDVCFINGADPTDCVRAFALMAVYGGLEWKKDDYA